MLHTYAFTAQRRQTGRGLVLLLSIVALLACAGAFTLAHLQTQPHQIQQQQQAKLDFAAAYLQSFLALQLEQAEALAKSNLILHRLNQSSERQRLSKELSQALPHTTIKVLSDNDFQNNELSFTERDLLRQLRHRNIAYTFVAGTKAQLVITALANNRGAIILAVELAPWFKPLANSLNQSEGLQIADSEGTTLWQSGIHHQMAKHLTTSGWRIQFYSEANATDLSTLFLGYGVTFLFILGFAAFGITSLRNTSNPPNAPVKLKRPKKTTNKEQPTQNKPPAEPIFDDSETSTPPALGSFTGTTPGVLIEEVGEEQSDPTTAVLDRVWPTHVFRRNGIVGSTRDDIDTELFSALGKIIGTKAQQQNQNHIIVARDDRASSEALTQALNDGLISTGCQITYLNACPLPVLQYACTVLTSQTGLYVTGGTGGANDNGLKAILNGSYLNGQELLALCQNSTTTELKQGDGTLEQRNLMERYIQAANDDIVLARRMTVAVDCANAVTGRLAEKFFTALGCQVIPLFDTPDGQFPNHLPNPAKAENMRALIQAVQAHNADIGFAFNGDGSSLGAVTPQGNIVWPDRLLMLFARDLLTRNPGADVLYDVECSRELAKLIMRMGGRPAMSQSGNTAMQAGMRENNATVGGEFRGHFYFADRWHGYDDGFYAAARLLEILTLDSSDTDQIFARIHTGLGTPTIEVPVAEGQQFKIVEALKRQSDAFEGATLNTLDGVRVEYEDGWGLVRVSQSRPSLMIRFEGQDKAILKDISERFRTELLNIDSTLRLPF